MPEPDIPDLLRQAQAAGGCADEFARIHLAGHVSVLNTVLHYQHTLGRFLAWMGEDTDHVRIETERRIAEAKGDLRGKLARLLAWARETGRE